jgi:hypothetical protein
MSGHCRLLPAGKMMRSRISGGKPGSDQLGTQAPAPGEAFQ